MRMIRKALERWWRGARSQPLYSGIRLWIDYFEYNAEVKRRRAGMNFARSLRLQALIAESHTQLSRILADERPVCLPTSNQAAQNAYMQQVASYGSALQNSVPSQAYQNSVYQNAAYGGLSSLNSLVGFRF